MNAETLTLDFSGTASRTRRPSSRARVGPNKFSAIETRVRPRAMDTAVSAATVAVHNLNEKQSRVLHTLRLLTQDEGGATDELAMIAPAFSFDMGCDRCAAD